MTYTFTPSKTPGFFFRYVLGPLSLGLLCLGATAQVSLAGSPEVVDRIVAVVNDDIIVLQEVNSLVESLQEQIETAGYSEEQKRSVLEEMRQGVINQLVTRKLIIQAAKEYEELGYSVSVSEAEIDASVDRIKEDRQLTDEQLSEALKQSGLSIETLRSQLKDQALESTLENIVVRSKIVITKEDVTNYYNQHPEKYHGLTTYHLRNILIKAPMTATPAEKEAVEKKLAQVFAELKSGKSFEDLARQYSESPFAHEGGELGNFKLNDLSPNLRAAIEPLSPGEYTQALETSDGYQVLFVQEIKKEADTPLDSVYKEIESLLYKEQYTNKRQAWTESLRENAHIKIIQ